MTVIHERVSALNEGQFEQGICRLQSGWVVLGDVQFVEGYSLIYPDPVVADFNALNTQQRVALMHDVGVLGDVILKVTGALRMNYEILGNLAPALHVHVFPRFDHEPDALKTKPVWFYDWEKAERFDKQKHHELMSHIDAGLRNHPETTYEKSGL